MTHAINLADVIDGSIHDYLRARGVPPAGIRCSVHTLRYVVWHLHERSGNDAPASIDPDTARFRGVGFEIENRMRFGEFDVIPAGVTLG